MEQDAILRVSTDLSRMELIKLKYDQIKHKKIFLTFFCAYMKGKGFDVKLRSVQNNWFGAESVPEKHEEMTLDYVTNYLEKEQNGIK